jgi:hypothetical protein
MESHIEIGIWRFLPVVPLPKRLVTTNIQSLLDLDQGKLARSFLIGQLTFKCGTMKHLEEVGMGYFQHMFGAFKLAFRFTLGAIMLVIHAFLPNIFVNAGKNTVDHYNSP